MLKRFRGVAPGMIRATDYGLNIQNYFENIEKNLLIVCQIENEEGVLNIQDIADVEGVDMLFIGQWIYQGIGCFGKFNDPKFVDLIEKAKKDIIKLLNFQV